MLAGGLALSGAALLGRSMVGEAPVSAAAATTPVVRGLLIRPRDDWASGLPVVGPLDTESDVRVLLVHHTASSNTYDDAAGQLRAFYTQHVGPKGWPDIAYNFLVDRFGVVWEGRAGSVAGPVVGSATGGNQGFSQLAAFIGDHSSAPPTTAAQESMIRLLAWLGEREGIDTNPGATTSFVSRGSNRYPAGTEVVVRTISGHRDLSFTTCPGDATYALIARELPERVSAYRGLPPVPPTGDVSVTAVAGGFRVAGRVVASAAAPVSVSVFVDREPVQTSTARGDGRFDLVVSWPPGRAEVCVYAQAVGGPAVSLGCRTITR